MLPPFLQNYEMCYYRMVKYIVKYNGSFSTQYRWGERMFIIELIMFWYITDMCIFMSFANKIPIQICVCVSYAKFDRNAVKRNHNKKRTLNRVNNLIQGIFQLAFSSNLIRIFLCQYVTKTRTVLK